MDIVVRIADAWLPRFTPTERLVITATFNQYRQIIFEFFDELAYRWSDISSLKLLFLYHSFGCLLLVNSKKVDLPKLTLWTSYYLAVDRILFDLDSVSVKYLRGLLKGQKVITTNEDLLYVTSLVSQLGRSTELLTLFEAQLESAKYKSRSDYDTSLYETVTINLGKSLLVAFGVAFGLPPLAPDLGYLMIVVSEIDDNRTGLFQYHQSVKTLQLFLLELVYRVSTLPNTHNVLKPLFLGCLVYYSIIDRCISKEWMEHLMCHVPLSLI